MSMATQAPHLRSHAIEDYAKAIYVLETRGSEPVSTTALAERLDVTAGSVSAMVKKLAARRAGPPQHHLVEPVADCLVETADHRRQHVRLSRVEVVTGPVKVGRHR